MVLFFLVSINLYISLKRESNLKANIVMNNQGLKPYKFTYFFCKTVFLPDNLNANQQLRQQQYYGILTSNMNL